MGSAWGEGAFPPYYNESSSLGDLDIFLNIN